MRFRRPLVLAVTAVILVLVGAGCAPESKTYPNSMAAAGDSITRAFDIDWVHVLSDSPQYSWSTGTSGSVRSEYQRLLALNPALANRNHNDARTGAVMADLDGQVRTAAAQDVDYLTVLMGANDVCTSSPATMTPTATFRAQFHRALADFTAARPEAKVFVSSIPNLYQLWSVLHTNTTARNVWSLFGICQSMLATGNTEAQRQQVVTREQADNAILRDECAAFRQCRFDGLATYGYTFRASDISTVDYFHPNTSGQKALAGVAWSAGYWSGS